MNFSNYLEALAHARHEAWVQGKEAIVVHWLDGRWGAGIIENVFTFSEYMQDHVGPVETVAPTPRLIGSLNSTSDD